MFQDIQEEVGAVTFPEPAMDLLTTLINNPESEEQPESDLSGVNAIKLGHLGPGLILPTY